jgi:hypothetical protein
MTGLKRTAARILAAAAILVFAVIIVIAACGNPYVNGILGEPGDLPTEQPDEAEQPDEEEQPVAVPAAGLTIDGADAGLYAADVYRYTESALSDLSDFAVWQKAADNSKLTAFGLAEVEDGTVFVRLHTPSGADFTASGTFLVKVTRENTQTARYGIVRFVSGRGAVNWWQMSAIPTAPAEPTEPAEPVEQPPDPSAVKTFAAAVSAMEKSTGRSEVAYTLAHGTEDFHSSIILTTAESPAKVVIDGGWRTITGIENGITVGAGVSLTLRNITFTNIPFTVAAGGVLVLDAYTVVRESWTGITVNGGTLDMNAGALVTANHGSGVRVAGSGGVFTMNGGEIVGNTTEGNGGGVRIHGSLGVFTMNGGEICDNTAGGSGGGVSIESPTNTFNMIAGTISGNTAEDSVTQTVDMGGGVAVLGGVFNMSGGEIRGNNAVYGYGGGVYIEGAEAADCVFTMSGGAIYGNTGGREGGGVAVFDGARFELKAGEVYGNAIIREEEDGGGGGGGVSLYRGTFDMEGGKVHSNIAHNGGGVFARESTVNVTDGVIGGDSPYIDAEHPGTANVARQASDGGTDTNGGLHNFQMTSTINVRAAQPPLVRNNAPDGAW